MVGDANPTSPLNAAISPVFLYSPTYIAPVFHLISMHHNVLVFPLYSILS